MQNLLIVGLAAIVLTGIYYVLGNNLPQDESIETVLTPVGRYESSYGSSNTASGMLVEENAVVTTQQRPGTTVKVAEVFLSEPGYVVIHENANGQPGAVLGTSAYLQRGETTNIAVTLSRPTVEGEQLWSMLHGEQSADTSFDVTKDEPIQSVSGGPLMVQFDIVSESEQEVEVKL